MAAIYNILAVICILTNCRESLQATFNSSHVVYAHRDLMEDGITDLSFQLRTSAVKGRSNIFALTAQDIKLTLALISDSQIQITGENITTNEHLVNETVSSVLLSSKQWLQFNLKLNLTLNLSLNASNLISIKFNYSLDANLSVVIGQDFSGCLDKFLINERLQIYLSSSANQTDFTIDDKSVLPVNNSCLENCPCVNGFCLEWGVSNCSCHKGFYGDLCTKTDFCVRDNITCSGKGRCVNFNATSWYCNCNDGYTGDLCEDLIDFCRRDSVNCTSLSRGVCYNDPSSLSAKCNCSEGYVGDNCQFTNCSLVTSCLNGVCATKEDDSDWFCRCFEGWGGDTCSACVDSYCNNRGSCYTSESSSKVSCKCSSNYILPRCANVDFCANNSCLNNPIACHLVGNASILDDVTYRCDCSQGYSGTSCEVKSGMTTTEMIILIVGLILFVIALIGIIVTVKIVMDRRKGFGVYKPSKNELSGTNSKNMSMVLRPPNQERLI